MATILHAKILKRNNVEFSFGTSLAIIYKSKTKGIEKQAQLTYSPFKNVFFAYFSEDDVDFEIKTDNSKVVDRNVFIQINFQNEKFQRDNFGYITKKEETTFLKSITTFGKNLHFSSNSTTKRFGRLVVDAHYSNKLAQHMTVGIQVPTNGKLLEFVVSQYNTVWQLKEMIMKVENVDIPLQVLYKEGRGKKHIFSNDMMLMEANVENGDVLGLEIKDVGTKGKKKVAGAKKPYETRKNPSPFETISDLGKSLCNGTPQRIQPAEAMIGAEVMNMNEKIQIFRPDINLAVESYEIELRYIEKLNK